MIQFLLAGSNATGILALDHVDQLEGHLDGSLLQLINVIKCKNPRCITTTEQELDHMVRLTDRDKKVYRCIYCETKAN